VAVVPCNIGWSDIGSWAALGDLDAPDTLGNRIRGEALLHDTRDTTIHSGQRLVGAVGLDHLIIIDTPDALLVANKDRAQDVKLAVTQLKAQKAPQAETFPRDHRPWGWYESLALGERFQVKRIVVLPGGALSLQSHRHRAEHWIVVEGTAKVTIDADVRLIAENQSVYIPLGAVHRLENPSKVNMVLIEVQTGSYLGEDDIIRYEDVYARGQGAKG